MSGLGIFATAALLAGCGSAAGGTTPTQQAQGQTTPASNNQGPVEIAFWHAMGGGLEPVIQELVSHFNSTHPNVHVTATFQGNYDDELNKFRQSGKEDGPDVIQVYDIGTRYMIDSGRIVPMQQFIDQSQFDLSKFEPNVLGYYSVDNKLYSMPFNTSNPVLYYNKDAFQKAGLDPNKPPRTYSEFAQDAQKLTVKNAAGTTTQYGAGIAIYGWFFEQELAEADALFADNNNGRTSRATAAVFNQSAGVNFVNWWKSMIDQGSMANLGRNTADTQKAFEDGKIAMTLDSTGGLTPIVDAVGNKFKVGVGYLPKPDNVPQDKGGVIIGGASLWITNSHPDKEEAAWEFVSWLSQPEQQALWHAKTGYFATRTDAYDQPIAQQFHQKYPQLEVAINQLHDTKLDYATQGALVGTMTQARQEVESAIESVLGGQQPTQQALDQAAQQISSQIKQYNLQTGK